jgi:hypothetical protein
MRIALPATAALLALSTALAGCATTPMTGPVQVARFHLQDVGRGTVAVEPLSATGPASIEFKTYAAAVQTELLRAGYTVPAQGETARYLATVNFTRTARDLPPEQSPVRIGLGGGGFSGGGGYRGGGGVGLGGGVSFPIGKSRPREAVMTELAVQIKDRSDGSAIWEGRAQTVADLRAPDATADAAAGRLAHALFLGFPGESGRTITVK